ncbi:MAG: UDP-N-acetylmuramate--L-alanine ligase [Candidatus Dasytiphilus stammeri]
MSKFQNIRLNWTLLRSSQKYIHFIGIGGSGMGSLAEILVREGYLISGSDLQHNTMTEHLLSLGVTIYFTHDSSHVQQACIVVISTAIDHNNSEITAAYEAHIPVIRRAQMLSEVMRNRYSIAVAGSHGKTTTTALLATIYTKAGLDPTFINGGILKATGTPAHLGCSKYLILEADESDGSFLYLRPMVAVITNIDAEHMDTYKGKLDNLKGTFIKFLNNLPDYGHIIICVDNLALRHIWPDIKRNIQITTYGFSEDADLRITHYKQESLKSYFCLLRKNKTNLSICLNMPGRHNALNAAAAVAVATEEGIADSVILQSLSSYQGTLRRFEFRGEFFLQHFNGKVGSVLIVDDYGHHPTELAATIQTIRISWPQKRLVMIFQPHRYTRTRNLYNDFVSVLSQLDIILLLQVYSAGETPINGANSSALCHSINILNKKIKAIFVSTHSDLINLLYSLLKNNDLVLIQGAGNIRKIPDLLITHLLPRLK